MFTVTNIARSQMNNIFRCQGKGAFYISPQKVVNQLYSTSSSSQKEWKWKIGTSLPIIAAFCAFAGLYALQNKTQSIASLIKKIQSNQNLQDFKKDWKRLCAEPINRTNESEKIKLTYQQEIKRHSPLVDIKYPDLLGFHPTTPGELILWMPGMALIATHLAEKKGLKGLFVCENREALFAKIQEIIADKKDQKCALIVGVNGLDLRVEQHILHDPRFSGFTEHSSIDTCDRDYPRHKIMIGIEKKEGELKIVLLDSLREATVDSQDRILIQILHTCKAAGCAPDLFISDFQREFTNYGCAIFALQDSVSFLQNPNFFTSSPFESVERQGFRRERNRELIKEIRELPRAHMIPTQSVSRLNDYKKQERYFSFQEVRSSESFINWLFKVPQRISAQPIPGKTKTLEEYANRYFVKNSSSNVENHYTTKKMWSYMHFVNAALQELEPEEIKKMIHATLLMENKISQTPDSKREK